MKPQAKKASRMSVFGILKSLAIAYLLICVFMWAFQRNLLYAPVRQQESPAHYGLAEFQTIRLHTKDNIELDAWYHPAKPGYPTIIYFHGNGGHLGHRAHFFHLLTNKGFGVFGLDYRGYGASTGSPSEHGFYTDAETLMEYTANNLKLPSNKLILYGESIGTGVAVQMAAYHKVAAVILQSPFASVANLAEQSYPWLPVKFLLKDKFDSIKKISAITSPILFFHGERDSIVPIAEGKALFAQANPPKEAIYYPEIGHNNFDQPTLIDAIIAFCKKYHL